MRRTVTQLLPLRKCLCRLTQSAVHCSILLMWQDLLLWEEYDDLYWFLCQKYTSSRISITLSPLTQCCRWLHVIKCIEAFSRKMFADLYSLLISLFYCIRVRRPSPVEWTTFVFMPKSVRCDDVECHFSSVFWGFSRFSNLIKPVRSALQFMLAPRHAGWNNIIWPPSNYDRCILSVIWSVSPKNASDMLHDILFSHLASMSLGTSLLPVYIN